MVFLGRSQVDEDIGRGEGRQSGVLAGGTHLKLYVTVGV